jgi:hypothetical protein
MPFGATFGATACILSDSGRFGDVAAPGGDKIKLGHVALDGTKVKANASKHKAMSYAHMKIKKRA